MQVAETLPTPSRDAQASTIDEVVPAATPTLALNVIAVILVGFTLYFAAGLLAPIAVAVLLSMLLSPLVQAVEKIGIPRGGAAIVVVGGLVIGLGVGLVAFSAPATGWIARAPESIHKLQEKFQGFSKPFDQFKKAADQIAVQQAPGDRSGPQEVRVVKPGLTDVVLLGSPQIIASTVSVLILLLFLLAAGDVFLRKLVTVIPTLTDKKRAVDITRQIENDISVYLLNFTMVNFGLGVAVALALMVIGFPNPLLFGALVAVLNFVPYLGSLSSMAILGIVGAQTFDSPQMALVAPAIQLVFEMIASQVVTPLLLGRGLQLNPVAIFIAIMLWGWLWGIVGVLLAVPLLASFKIVCERIKSLNPIAEFLTT